MPTTRNIIIFIAVALVFVLGYVFFIRSSPGDEATLVSSPGIPTPNASLQVTTVSGNGSFVADEFLTLLLSVKSIKLNDAIFSDSAFSSLSDSTITLVPDDNEGRSNPFAPFGVEDISTTPPTQSLSAPDITAPNTAPNTTPSTPPATVPTKPPANNPPATVPTKPPANNPPPNMIPGGPGMTP